MHRNVWLKRKWIRNAVGTFYSLVAISLMVLWAQPVMAVDFELGGKPVTIMGYLNQGFSFGVVGSKPFDTKQDYQAALMQGLVEVRMAFSRQLKFFGSVGLNADWAYPTLQRDSEWRDKDFDKSYDDLFIYGEGRDILQELHMTWTPQNWFLRAGKQIVVWGETDGFRLMDQINPLDQRRGLADIEFENTVLPIWLLRAEYYVPLESGWLQDLGFEFIFNPNPDFRGDQSIVPGNDEAGIWAPMIKIRNGRDYSYLGSFDASIDEPTDWDDEGFEYGLRIKSVIKDTIITLNGFYGRDNLPALLAKNQLPRIETNDWDGRSVIHPAFTGKYPLFRFVGFTLTRDFENLYLSQLGGVAPVLRIEAFYAFDNTFVTAGNEYSKHDEMRYAIGIDWKVWIRSINPRAAFMISPQFFHRKIRDHEDGLTYDGKKVRDDNYSASLMINTTYFHNKIQPMFFWLRDISQKSNLFKIQVTYERSDVWNYTLGTLLLNGAKTGQGFQPLTNKDQIYFTIGYRFQ